MGPARCWWLRVWYLQASHLGKSLVPVIDGLQALPTGHVHDVHHPLRALPDERVVAGLRVQLRACHVPQVKLHRPPLGRERRGGTGGERGKRETNERKERKETKEREGGREGARRREHR